MNKLKNSLKKTLAGNACIAAIIVFVYMTTFAPLGGAVFAQGPALKGNTGGDNVALQIVVNDGSNVEAYMDALDSCGVKGTFFFCEQCAHEQQSRLVTQRGHALGYYVCALHGGRQSVLYIGGGYGVPVMSYTEEDGMREVCPSIDITKLKKTDGWTETFKEAVAGDMFIYIRADNNLADFEKVVQIVLDKGYTILKVNEML